MLSRSMATATKTRPKLTELRERRLWEFADGKARVDRDNGIIFGVKVVGKTSTNTHGVPGVTGTDYTSDALASEAKLLEGINVNVDHPPRKGSQERSAYDRFAWLENVECIREGIFGDLHFLDPADPLAIKMMRAAELKPEAFALSHNAMGRGEAKNGRYVVSEIVEVRSVDIVADGGTNRSLFESEEGKTMKLSELLEKAPGKYPRLEKLVKLFEDEGDMDVSAAPEPDEMDHLFNAFKSCMKDNPDKAKKILALLKPEATPVEEESDEEAKYDDPSEDSNSDKKTKEGRTVKTPAPGEITLTESRARAMCKTAGIEPTQDVLDAVKGATFDQGLAIINLAKRAVAPVRQATPPRSTGRVPVMESTAPAATDSKGWATKLLG